MTVLCVKSPWVWAFASAWKGGECDLDPAKGTRFRTPGDAMTWWDAHRAQFPHAEGEAMILLDEAHPGELKSYGLAEVMALAVHNGRWAIFTARKDDPTYRPVDPLRPVPASNNGESHGVEGESSAS